MWINACVISFVIAAVFEPLLIPFLRKLKFGQTILEDGPSWHEKKQGTPTMGGIGFILSTTAASLLFVRSARGTGILLCGVLFGAIGFLDDYIKVIKKQRTFRRAEVFASDGGQPCICTVFVFCV